MTKIKNINYRKFIDKGLIDIITQDELKQALANIKGRYRKEGRALLICLYFTGGRPVEVLSLKAEQVQRKDSYVTVEMQAAKRGLNRTIFLPYRYALVKELYFYAASCFNKMFLFYHYRGNYKRTVTYKSGKVVERIDITDKLRYHVKRWFRGVVDGSIPPYFLRHNRFSQLSEAGLTSEELRQLKGSKTTGSVEAYLHLSSRTAKKIAKKIK